ncbi:hypothetical protein BHQ15_13740 [Mycolicibacillus koreensis]|nr:hypothetical protein BHQ15_13740 [Mycolicibacillus koreensis]
MPPLAPPVPVVPVAPPVAAAAPAAAPGAVLADASAPAGKGVPTNPSPDDVPDLVVLPGPPLS